MNLLATAGKTIATFKLAYNYEIECECDFSILECVA